MRPKLIDFGKALRLNNDFDDSSVDTGDGTCLFAPPEYCSFDSNYACSLKKADVWAFGITLYLMTFREFPFELAKTDYL